METTIKTTEPKMLVEGVYYAEFYDSVSAGIYIESEDIAKLKNPSIAKKVYDKRIEMKLHDAGIYNASGPFRVTPEDTQTMPQLINSDWVFRDIYRFN